MNINGLQKAATTVRTLSADGVQSANSGHPGLPMGCAELGALLYGEVLKHTPEDAEWVDRDRFVLSAGHGSMFLYSLLYLSGYGLTKEDLSQFRQLGSMTPGHPEHGWTRGVETTTGPLGAGFSNAVGMAVAEQMLAAKFNTAAHKIVDHYTYALSGDGCMMEGVTSEAASFAGHQKLGKLIVFYDSNKITIEGSTELAFTEDVMARYAAYGWQTLEGDAYDFDGISALIAQAKADTGRPTLIKLNSIIGKGAPTLAGTHKVHGAPLGEEERAAMRKNLGVPADTDFYVFPEAEAYFTERKSEWKNAYTEWQAVFAAWESANPELKKEWDLFMGGVDPNTVELPEYTVGDALATRSASGKALNAFAAIMPNLVGGSADLAPSNNTAMPGLGDFGPEERDGRTFHFGVREHGMGGIVNGMVLHGGLRVFCATFMVFADYMRPPMRLASLMKLPVIYVLTHDSIFVGEDGPTHQPVEHLASMRIIPGLQVMRPADAEETSMAWMMALMNGNGPTALALTRQNLPVFAKPANWKEEIVKGAYIALDCDGDPDLVIAATGSEVSIALEAAAKLTDKKVRVVSVICRDRLMEQDAAWRESILPAGVRTVVAEAGVSFGWEGIASSAKDILCIDRFGESGPYAELAVKFGITADNLVNIING